MDISLDAEQHPPPRIREALALEATDNPLLQAYPRANGIRKTSGTTAWDRAVHRYGFAVPTKEAIDLIAKQGAIVEMGAGRGYWASQLQRRGVDIIAYDHAPGKDHTLGPRRHLWADVKTGTPADLRDHQDRALLLIWPPQGNPACMATECLTHWHGDTLIYIGEPQGGCTAGDRFFETLARDHRLERIVDLPNWTRIHDQLFLYKRISQPSK